MDCLDIPYLKGCILVVVGLISLQVLSGAGAVAPFRCSFESCPRTVQAKEQDPLSLVEDNVVVSTKFTLISTVAPVI